MATNFFQIVAVSSASPTWSGAVAINLDSDPEHLMLCNKHATCVVEYSFDGTNLHGELDPADATVAKTFDDRRVGSGIFFRVKSGSTGPANVSVEAWLSR